MQQMSTVQGNLATLARDYDQAQRKAGKLKSQGGKASAGKVAGASDQVDSAAQQWESQAPYVFEQLQAVDESRLNHLRDVLTQLETHEVDHVEKAKVQAESCLNSLLNVDVADEIKSWSSKRQGGSQRAPSRAEATRTPSRDERPPVPTSTSRMERRLSRHTSGSNTLAPPPVSSYNGDDRTSQRAPSFNEEKPEEKKRPRGLKRLGTVFSKRRQSMMIPSLGRTSGRHKSRLGSSTNLPEEDVPELPTPQPPAKDREGAISPAPLTARTEPPAAAEGRLQPETSPAERPVTQGATTNGVSRLQDPLVPAFTTASSSAAVQQIAQPHTQVETPTTTANETFMAPPQSAATDPITAAQREAAAAAAGGSAYSEFPDQSQQQQAFNLSIRNAPIAEEDNTANSAAMTDVANALRAQAPKRTGTLRGRRDVRNTIFVPSDQAPVFENNAQPATNASFPSVIPPPTTSPFATSPSFNQSTANSTPQPPQRPFATDDRASASDTQSIRSGRSLASTTAVAPIRHPETHTPGLSSSIIETVSATFSAGQLTRGNITGELALAYTPNPSSTAASTTDTVRLDNFPILEKVAPNPAFVHDLLGDRRGEYTIDLPMLSSKPNIAFKYQLHVPADDAATVAGRHAPLIVTPSWRIEEKQTSVIVSYALNPAFAGQDTTLHNVVLLLFLDGRASTCQSRPAGTFSREKSMIYWRFDELKLDAAPSKALARFATDGTAKQGRVEARWEMSLTPGVLGQGLGISRLEGGGDPFADGSGEWREVRGVRRAMAGSYVGL